MIDCCNLMEMCCIIKFDVAWYMNILLKAQLKLAIKRYPPMVVE